eukprot:3641931-Amphidinium_carterae.1
MHGGRKYHHRLFSLPRVRARQSALGGAPGKERRKRVAVIRLAQALRKVKQIKMMEPNEKKQTASVYS